MFVLSCKSGFYSGRAGPAWVGPKAEAFAYSSQEEAERKAALFNSRSALHGLIFEVRPLVAPDVWSVAQWLEWLEKREHAPALAALKECAQAIRAAAPEVLERPAPIPA